MKIKERLIDEYRNLKMHDINGFNKIMENLEVYLNENGSDTQLELVLHMARTRKINYLGASIESYFEAAKPAIDMLLTTDDGFFEIEAIAAMLHSAESYELSKRLMQKALNALDTKFADHENCELTKLLVFSNMSYRLLHSRFYDKEDPTEIKKLFDHCIKSGITICKKRGTNSLILKIILLARQAVFYEDFVKLSETLLELKALRNSSAFKATQDEIVEFYNKISIVPPTEIVNIFMGHQIMRRREQLGLSREELAVKVRTEPQYVGALERGRRGLSLSSLMTYVKALEVDYNYMLSSFSQPFEDITTNPEILQMREIVSSLPENSKLHALEYLKIFALLFNYRK